MELTKKQKEELQDLGFVSKDRNTWWNRGVFLEKDSELKEYEVKIVPLITFDGGYAPTAHGVKTIDDLKTLCRLING